jgi:hypothetical protein
MSQIFENPNLTHLHFFCLCSAYCWSSICTHGPSPGSSDPQIRRTRDESPSPGFATMSGLLALLNLSPGDQALFIYRHWSGGYFNAVAVYLILTPQLAIGEQIIAGTVNSRRARILATKHPGCRLLEASCFFRVPSTRVPSARTPGPACPGSSQRSSRGRWQCQ